MSRRKGINNFNKSEGESLIEYVDRHKDWCVIVCLVGGGQEINTGEAGISAWLLAIRDHFPHFQVHISSQLNDPLYDANNILSEIKNVKTSDSLHLKVSMRSFRQENLSNFIGALLDIKKEEIQKNQIDETYPIFLTRDIDKAKEKVKAMANQGKEFGNERFGLLASSRALRLKPLSINMRNKINPVHYFLKPKDDTRSSNFLEDAASEFECQGLELDYTIVCWDADLRYKNNCWQYHDFKGDKWIKFGNTELEPDRQKFLLNSYRVLLTRARQGMIIFVPKGNYPPDHTRMPEYYDGTYEYLRSLELKEL